MKIKKTVRFFTPTLIFLVILEIVARIINLPPYPESNEKGMYTESAECNFELTPGYKGSISSIEYLTNVYVNDQGFRDTKSGSYSDGEIDESRKKVLFIGDSITFGQGVEYEDSYVGLFLQSDDYFPINAGVPSYGPTNSLALLKKKGVEVDPDYVVYTMYPANDVYDTARGYVKYVIDGYLTESFPKEMNDYDIRVQQLTRGVPQTSESSGTVNLPSYEYFDIKKVPNDAVVDTRLYSETKYINFVDRFLVKISEVYRYMRYKALFISPVRKLYSKKEVVKVSKCIFPYSRQIFYTSFPRNDYETRVLDTIKSEISEMRDFSENELGAKFFVGIAPVREQVNKELLEYEKKEKCFGKVQSDINKPDMLLVNLFKEANIKYVLLSTPLRAKFEEGKDPFFKIDTHLNQTGHQVVYDTYKEVLDDL